MLDPTMPKPTILPETFTQRPMPEIDGYRGMFNPKLAAEGAKNRENLPTFGQMFEKAQNSPGEETETAKLEEAGRRMEVLLTTLMLKTMESSSTEGGFLGNASQGMGYFKDLFLEQVAESMTEGAGLGFREAMVNTFASKPLSSKSQSR